ncbi:MAG: OmpA family protein [Burkholderiaceae bacterium]|nr:OmpA family protein [Burkholderiaceae bacterium]
MTSERNKTLENSSQEENAVLWLLPVVGLVLALTIAIALRVTAVHAAPALPLAVSPTATDTVTEERASTDSTDSADRDAVVILRNEIELYFPMGSAILEPGVDKALSTFVVAAKTGQRIQIAGFHDAVGDARFNRALAKRRAEAVMVHLLALGVPKAQLAVSEPTMTQGSGSEAQARRVEVRVLE